MINRVLDTSDMSKPFDRSLDISTGTHHLEASLIDHAEILQPGAILSMQVHDPREVSSEVTDSPLETVKNQDNKLLEEGDLVPNVDEAPSEERPIFSSMQMHSGRHDLLLSDCREMWDSDCKINAPVAEEILCMKKHHRRINFFCLDSENDQVQATQANDCFSRSCPVILLKHAKERLVSFAKPSILIHLFNVLIVGFCYLYYISMSHSLFEFFLLLHVFSLS